jgi:hypothetical protein
MRRASQLPIAWPMTSPRAGVMTGGVGFGNVNVEPIQLPGQTDPRPRLVGVAFEPSAIDESLIRRREGSDNWRGRLGKGSTSVAEALGCHARRAGGLRGRLAMALVAWISASSANSPARERKSGSREAPRGRRAQASRLYGPGLSNKYDATIGTSLGKTVGSEDCLYLNIWRPANAAAQLPVIVWVHGGSNISGYTADPM